MNNLSKSKNLRIIFSYLASIIILGLIPLFWSNKVTFDLVKITEEWYKVIISLILILIGFFFFDYLIERNERRKEEQAQKKISKNLDKYRANIIELFAGNLNRNEGQLNLMSLLYTLKLVELNFEKFISDITILAYDACYNNNVRDSIQILITELQENKNIRTDAKKNLEIYFNEVDNFLQLIE